MLQEIEAQIHFWPWSVGIREETRDLLSSSVSFPFYGSPVLSISTGVSVYLPQRNERFTRFGPPFRTPGGEYQLYETPHGILTSREKDREFTGDVVGIQALDGRIFVRIAAEGARSRYSSASDGEINESKLARTVLAWSQVFDDLIEVSQKKWKRENRFPWVAILDFIANLKLDISEPRMALIVHIAETMRRQLTMIVNGARKILVRERLMLPAGIITETDKACLYWYVRQPGRTMAEKAAANRQSLLGVSRKETYNTLENRVLKDFLLRCSQESKRYLKAEVGNNPALKDSERAIKVRSFGNLCSNLIQAPFMGEVDKPPSCVQPNYALQNDFRYRQVWQLYKRLLRREDEEDRMWDWQSRTWADVARLLVGAALFQLFQYSREEPLGKVVVEELLKSDMQLLREQHLGCRMQAGSEPGPFLIRHRSKDFSMAAVLEIIHSDLAHEHVITQNLGRVGGHLYLVMTPLNGDRRKVVVVWAIHTAASEIRPPWEEIASSAERALKQHALGLGERIPDFPELHGFVVASDLEEKGETFYNGPHGQLWLVRVPADQRHWKDAVEGLALVIDDVLEKTL